MYALIAFGLALSSCSNTRNGEKKPSPRSNVIGISDNEYKGIKDILGFYGGYCKYSIGYVTPISEGKPKYFEIEMSKSDVMEIYRRKGANLQSLHK